MNAQHVDICLIPLVAKERRELPIAWHIRKWFNGNERDELSLEPRNEEPRRAEPVTWESDAMKINRIISLQGSIVNYDQSLRLSHPFQCRPKIPVPSLDAFRLPPCWTQTQTIMLSTQFPQYKNPVPHSVYVNRGLGLNQYIPNSGDWLQISGNIWHTGSTKAMFKGPCFYWRGRGGYVGRVAQ